MKDERLQKLQHKLEEEKQDLLDVVARLTGPGGLEQPRDEAAQELSAYDNHPADYGSEMYERSKDMGLLELTRQQIDDIERAQSAISQGNYGYCGNCGVAIPEQRLLALPSTSLCVRCKRLQEDQDAHNRPVEEELMPLAEQSIAGEEEIYYEGDDAWELVSRYGTSSRGEKD